MKLKIKNGAQKLAFLILQSIPSCSIQKLQSEKMNTTLDLMGFQYLSMGIGSDR